MSTDIAAALAVVALVNNHYVVGELGWGAQASSVVSGVFALTAWLHAFAANLVSVAVRAIPLGQSDAVAVIAGLERPILRTATRAVASTLDDLGSGAILSDIVLAPWLVTYGSPDILDAT